MKSSDARETQDRRIRKTKKAIRQALETLLELKGIEQFTVKDLACEADIGYTTFFRHFPSKETALADFADSEAEDMIRHSLPMLRASDSLAATTEMCRHVAAKRRVWSALLLGGAAPLMRDRLIHHTLEMSGDWPQRQDWLPVESGTALVIGLVVETLGWWLAVIPDMTAEEVAQIMDRLFISQLVGMRDQGQAKA